MSLKDFSNASLGELVNDCRAQTELFMRQENADNSFCFEIWRRAVAERNDEAWNACIQQYAIFVRRWLSKKFDRHPGLRFEEEVLLNSVFINFFRFVSPEKFGTFQNLQAVLQYLKMCCGTIVADAMRDYQSRAMDVSLEVNAATGDDSGADGVTHGERLRSDFDIEEHVQEQTDRMYIWRAILDKIPDEADRLLLILRFLLDIPPREIPDMYPAHFPDVNNVYRRMKNLLWRLRNNPELAQELDTLLG
jgi:hypothetical protein